MQPFLFRGLCRIFLKKYSPPSLFFKHEAIKAGLFLLEKTEKLPSTTIKTGLHIHIEHTEQENTCSLMALRSSFAQFLFTVLNAPAPSTLPTSSEHSNCFSTQPLVLCCLMVPSLPHAVSEGIISVLGSQDWLEPEIVKCLIEWNKY